MSTASVASPSRSKGIVLGPAWRHAVPAAALATTLWAALRPAVPSVGASGLAPLDTLRALALPAELQLALGALACLGACVALYDVARAAALPRSAADACWWFAISPLAWVAFASPAGAVGLLSTALAWQLSVRVRFVGAGVAALVATVAAPFGVLSWLLVSARFAEERAWRMGAASVIAWLMTPAVLVTTWATTRGAEAQAALWNAAGFAQPAVAYERISTLVWDDPWVALPALLAASTLGVTLAARRASWSLRIVGGLGVTAIVWSALTSETSMWAALGCAAPVPFIAAALAERSEGATRWLWVGCALASAGAVALLAA